VVMGGNPLSENGSAQPTRFGEITRAWGDGTYVFRLPWGALRELEDKRKCGAPEILLRIMNLRPWVDDIREIIRLGLIHGGGVKPTEALTLVDRYVENRPLFESAPLAQDILSIVLIPPPSEKKSQDEDEEKLDPESEAAILSLLTSRGFTEMAQSSDSLPPKSTT
jgi:hypothetical protein